MTDESKTRRRGSALEEAILDAAWAELEHAGYNAFTYEAVAKRALTSRPVLYRRWETRLLLATAAIRHHIKRNPIVVPDLGNVRDELKQMLRRSADRAPPRLMRLLFDMSDDMAAEHMSFTDGRFGDRPIEPILKRAVARGEVSAERITPRIMRLPHYLVMLEAILTQRRVEDEAIEEIIDDVFLPLLQATKDKPK